MEFNKPLQDFVPSQLSRIIGICSGFQRGGNILKNLYRNKNEELKDLILGQIVREHVGDIVKVFLRKKKI